MPTPEEQARERIDQLLEAAGWQVQDRNQLNLGAARGVAVREFPLTTGFADYLLFADRKAVGRQNGVVANDNVGARSPDPGRASHDCPKFRGAVPAANGPGNRSRKSRPYGRGSLPRMQYNPREHHRRSIRLPGYDYRSPGAYFVTICTRQGECVLGQVVDGEVRLNEWGEIARDCWRVIPEHFPHVELDAYIVMPNHVHGIIVITDRAVVGAQVGADVGAQHAAPLQSSGTNVRSGSLGAIVRSFKSAVTRRINEQRAMAGVPVWQRNYWEHIIRNEESLNRIREYIRNNPARWVEDQLHPDAPANPFNQWPSR